MKIHQIDIRKIKPDLQQPRTVFIEEDIQGLAESIKREGIINAIEIDKNFVIILGERRFRAAKLAGLSTIPATIRDIYPRERFLRQLAENLHTGAHGSMVIMDLANAFAKILNDLEGDRKTNIKELAEKLGKKPPFITELLSLREETGEVKTYLEKPNAKYSFIIIANDEPVARIRNILKEKIINGEITNRDTVLDIRNAIERHPEREKQLLAETYTGKRVENLMKIHRIAPMEENLDPMMIGIDVANKFQGLLLAMKKLNLKKISPYDMAQIKKLIEIIIPQANQIHTQIYDIQQNQLTENKKKAIVAKTR